MASKEEAALTIQCPEDDPMTRRQGTNHQRRLWSDPLWRPVNQLVTLLSFAVFILDVEVFTLLVNSKQVNLLPLRRPVIVSMKLIVVKCQIVNVSDFVIKRGRF